MPAFFKFVPTSKTGIVTRFGKFHRTWEPGLRFFIPVIEKWDLVSNRTRMQKISLQVKSKDNVFSVIHAAIQMSIKKEDSVSAYFKSADLVGQLILQVENSIRSCSSKMTIDEMFNSHGEIARDVNSKISQEMAKFGMTIEDTLINDIEPDPSVKESMNKINSSERLKIAAKHEAEADYVRKVREAEADCERKRLIGEGISLQRTAIITGYETALQKMVKGSGMTPKEVAQFVKDVQYMDVLESIGQSPNSKILFMNQKNLDYITSLEAKE